MSPAVSAKRTPDPGGGEAGANPNGGQSAGSLSSPLDLRRRLARPDTRFDPVPFLDFCVLALLFGMLNAEFVFAPGLAVDLPESRGASVTGTPATAVLTVRRNMILFDGAKHTIDSLQPALVAYLASERAPERIESEGVLLLKMERDVMAEQFVEICEIAREAGFSQIQVASEPKADESTDARLRIAPDSP